MENNMKMQKKNSSTELPNNEYHNEQHSWLKLQTKKYAQEILNKMKY